PSGLPAAAGAPAAVAAGAAGAAGAAAPVAGAASVGLGTAGACGPQAASRLIAARPSTPPVPARRNSRRVNPRFSIIGATPSSTLPARSGGPAQSQTQHAATSAEVRS